MSRPRSNPVRYATLLSVEALLLTLVIHGFLLCGFAYEPPAPATSTRSGGALSLLKISLGSKGKAFCRWLAYHDPAIAVRSRSSSGYQSFLPQKKKFHSTLPALRYSEPKIPEPVVPSATKTAVPAAVSGGYLPQGPAAAPAQEGKYPFALFDSGRMVELAIPPDAVSLLGKLPSAPSRVMLGKAGEYAKIRRFSIRSSSGNRNADLLALQMVLPLAMPQEKACSVYWKSSKEEEK